MTNKSETVELVSPYGGKLINLVVSDKQERVELLQKAIELPSIQLSQRALEDLDLLAIGAFSPLDRFMSQKDYHSVLNKMRLASGLIFPIPITLAIDANHQFQVGREVILRSPLNEIIAWMKIEEIYQRKHNLEAVAIYGTSETLHPLVSEMSSWGDYYISGMIKVLNLPSHIDFLELRLTPTVVRERLMKFGNPNVVAFQTRNPLHRVHEEITKHAQKSIGATLLLHPTVGSVKAGDIDYFTRVRIYKRMYEMYYSSSNTLLAVLPLAMRFAGPREAVWHAIIRRNYGANYFIVGRDHASPGRNISGHPYYPHQAAQKLLQQVKKDIGVEPFILNEMVYVPQLKRYMEISRVKPHQKYYSLSGSEIRIILQRRKHLPRWYTRPEVAAILSDSYVPLHQRGFCVWFTGLPCAGKTTIASMLQLLLVESGRKVTLLDGDVVRTHLSKGLGFTKEDRDTNIRRIGFVAAEIVKHDGAVISATVSPYEATRNQVRALMPDGSFILVYVDTPLAVCEQRDTKGLYYKTRQGKIQGFTGIDDIYEPPTKPELRLTTVKTSSEKNAKIIYEDLRRIGFIKSL